MKVSTELIPRTDRGDDPERGRPVEWSTAEQCFRRGGVFWLVSPDPGGAPHQRPCFAAWHGVGFFLVGNAGARKTRNLLADGRASLGCDAGDMHLVVEGTVHRVTDENTLRSASTAFADIYSWPTQVAGDQLDAPTARPPRAVRRTRCTNSPPPGRSSSRAGRTCPSSPHAGRFPSERPF